MNKLLIALGLASAVAFVGCAKKKKLLKLQLNNTLKMLLHMLALL